MKIKITPSTAVPILLYFSEDFVVGLKFWFECDVKYAMKLPRGLNVEEYKYDGGKMLTVTKVFDLTVRDVSFAVEAKYAYGERCYSILPPSAPSIIECRSSSSFGIEVVPARPLAVLESSGYQYRLAVIVIPEATVRDVYERAREKIYYYYKSVCDLDGCRQYLDPDCGEPRLLTEAEIEDILKRIVESMPEIVSKFVEEKPYYRVVSILE